MDDWEEVGEALATRVMHWVRNILVADDGFENLEVWAERMEGGWMRDVMAVTSWRPWERWDHMGMILSRIFDTPNHKAAGRVSARLRAMQGELLPAVCLAVYGVLDEGRRGDD